eukprot:86507-Prymnesium_polylepis.1
MGLVIVLGRGVLGAAAHALCRAKGGRAHASPQLHSQCRSPTAVVCALGRSARPQGLGLCEDARRPDRDALPQARLRLQDLLGAGWPQEVRSAAWVS